MKMRAIGVLVSLLCGSVVGQDQADDHGFQSGKSMPFHVVDFVAGARTKGTGCPSVMIGNDGTRGIEIWSTSQAGAAIQLASALDGKLPNDDKARVFLVLFTGVPRASYTVSPKERALKKVLVAVPRGHRTPAIFEKADESRGSSVLVFFMEGKVIKSRFQFKPDELPPDRTQALAESAGKFLAGHQEK